MRGFRSTLILLAVLAALLGYIYFYMKPTAPQPESQKPKVFAIETDTFEEFRVVNSKGEASTVKKIDHVWQLVEPVQAKADEAEVAGLVTNLMALENQRTVDENATDLAQYGLESPRIKVGFRRQGETTVTWLLLGDKTATGADMYVKRPDDKTVFLISAYLDTTFDRSAFDLRNKSVLSFERHKVDAVEVAVKAQAVAFTKAGDDWRLSLPISARADTTVVDGLIGRLQTGQMKAIEVADPTPADLKTFGLDAPEITATVGAGSTRATLLVGKETPDGATCYARDAARAMVFTIEKSLVDDLRRKPADYRMKDVFDFRPFMASRLEVTRDGATMVFERKKDKDGREAWAQVTPAKDVEAAKIESLLSSLSGLQVTGWEDAPKAASPALVVAVTFDDGKKTERITFSRAGSDVFATRPGEPGAAKVEAARFDESVAALDAVK